jgi:DHA2 family multidrug resistance protein-like MFS transporter
MAEQDRAGVSSAGTAEWIGLAVLALPLLVVSLDVSVLYLAAPALAADLAPSATQLLWILDVYGFVIAGFLLTMGTLGDRIGRRRLLLVGATAFAVASVIAAYAPSAEWLIAARALLGVAGATLMPSTLGLISVMFRDAAQRSFAIAIWMTTFTAGAVLGPVVGGLMLARFWWGSVFLLGVPVAIVLLVLGPRLLPEFRDPAAGRPDPPSVVLSLAAMLPLVYGVKRIAADGPDGTAVLALVAGGLAGWVFVRRQRRLAYPMLDVALFTRPAFAAAVGLLLTGLLAVNGLMYLLPQYLQLVAGHPALAAGLLMLPVAVLAAVGGLLSPRLATRFGPTAVIAVFASLALVAMLVLGGVAYDGPPALVVALVSLAVLGISPVPVLGTDLVVGSVPVERTGSAAAVSETAGELGVALGVAVTGSIMTAVYVTSLQLPAGIAPADAAVGEGLPGTLAAAERLPEPAGTLLADAARAAFSAGFGAVAIAGAALVAVAVALTLVVSGASTSSARRPGPG